MSRRPIVAVPCALVLALSAIGCGGAGRIDYWDLVTAGRDGWQRPDRVMEALAVAPGDRIADIGAGDGYWLPVLSAAVGDAGRIYAVEVDDEKIAVLEARVAEEGLANVVVVRGDFHDPRLPDAGIDLALTCNTYHHIDDRELYFSRLRIDLAPGGRVAHIDHRHDLGPPLRWFQTEGHWSDPEAMRAEMVAAGYRRDQSFDFLPLQSLQLFVPAGANARARGAGGEVAGAQEAGP
jgi:predicted methyltransferase